MKQKNYKAYLANILPCISYGLLCGFLTGAVIFLFKLLARHAEELSRSLYAMAKGSWLSFLAIVFLLVFFAFAMSRLHKAAPECKGGGIPRSEGILRGILPFRWLRTLLATFFGSLLSFFAGLPVGSEGPAVLIGTSIGCMSCRFSKKQTAWNRYVMTGGAGAGFAVATGAPLSGILFSLEEIHKRISPVLVLTVSMAVLSATYTNQLLCSLTNTSPDLFEFSVETTLKLPHTGWLLLLGVLIAMAVGIFDASIRLFRQFTGLSKKTGSVPIKLLLVFLLAGLLALFLPDGVYSGHHLIVHILEHDLTVFLLFVLFLVRLILMLLITDSGATGGIFIPTLAIGALAAALIAKLLVFLGMPAELTATFILLGMCAFIGGTLRAPLTASVLFLELTGQFTNLFYVVLVVFTVSFITELLNQTPFYDKALEEMTELHHHGKHPVISCFELTVEKNSFVVGKAVRDIMWPHTTIIRSITYAQNGLEVMDDGEQHLYAGDKVIIQVCYYEEEALFQQLRGLVGNLEIIKLNN